MAAHLVHHHHHAAGAPDRIQRGDALVEVLEHDLVETLTPAAQGRIFQRAGEHLAHAFTQALAPGLVVQPQHRQPGALQHVQQVLIRLAGGFMGLLAQVREHAGHRRLGVGAAGAHIAEIGQAALGLQLASCGLVGRG
jgi:hypothetical protein